METGGETEKGHSIGKLTGTQKWMAWKVQIHHIHRCRGQWKFAMGTEELKDDASVADKQRFEQKKVRQWPPYRVRLERNRYILFKILMIQIRLGQH